MNSTIPTPEEQVRFLRNLQRLLAEGTFSATYKFALIRALADLAVITGDDTGAPLEIETKDIAEKFVEMYWQQIRPFPGKTGHFVLWQSADKNPEKRPRVISLIEASRQNDDSSLFRLKQGARDRWSALVREVEKVVREYPLKYLQNVGKNEELVFLYQFVKREHRIKLKPGVAYCFRAFYELVRDLIEGAWVRFVAKLNADDFGNLIDLGTFLFGQERACLDAYRPILMDVQQGNCLYCRTKLNAKSQVDHFVPRSRYAGDFGHNFVLAHVGCNNSKSDHVAAKMHLAAWIERNHQHQLELQSRLVEAALPCDWKATTNIAKWVYRQTERAKGRVWVAKNVLEPLSPDWEQCFEM